MQKAEAILRSVLPGIDLDDPKYEARGIDQILESENRKMRRPAPVTNQSNDPGDDAQLHSMVENTGRLDVDDQGHWDYHGHSSGLAFMNKFRAQFGDLDLSGFPTPTNRGRQFPQILENSPRSSTSSPFDIHNPTSLDLPSKEVAEGLCRHTLDDVISLMRFVHQPSFYKKFERVFTTDPDHFTTAEVRFLPLLYVVMAVGCLFASTENSALDSKGYEDAIDRGYHYFQSARQMVDITDCRDLTTLQTVCFMIIFLQSTAKLSTCYSYLGIALRACCRLGLHRKVSNKFNPIEQEERKRTFWLIRRMDTYVAAMLGLPNMLSDDDIDQELPEEIDDEYITQDGILPMPSNRFPLMKAANAHSKLVVILQNVVRSIYPIKGFKPPEENHPGDGYSISHSRIRQIERDLQAWMDALPIELRPTEDAPRALARVQQLLRLSYAHIQMMLYRPFLHYVSQGCESKGIDKRSFACAAACVSVARNIVHITTEMKRRGLLIGSYWFVMYTTYLGILALVFFVLENPGSPTGRDILRDAMEGRDTLKALSKRSLAADRCSHSLAPLFERLPDKIEERKSSLSTPSSSVSSKKRPSPQEAVVNRANQSAPNVKSPQVSPETQPISARARSFPHELSLNVGKRQSLPDSDALTPQTFDEQMLQDVKQPQLWGMGSGNTVMTPSSSSTPFPGQSHFGNPNLPDMKPVMFPSDNPFAYPNQAISTLEAQQILNHEQPSNYSSPSSSGMYGMPNAQTPTSLSFDSTAVYGTPSQLQQQFMAPGRQMSQQMGQQIGGAPSYDFSQNPAEAAGMNFPGLEGTWSQMHGGRTGLTPGGINLDELFGGDGWNNVWSNQQFSRQQ